jgi:hypothetical protein
MSRGQSPAALTTATVIGMVFRPPGGGPGSYRIVDENGTVVAGDSANADGAFGLEFADHRGAN